MADFVEHTGVVESCDGQMVLVRIEQQAVCASCHAKGACSVAEKEDKIIVNKCFNFYFLVDLF